jgi:hypothetical protein
MNVNTVRTENYLATYKDDPEVRDAVFKKLVDFFAKHESFSAESVMQCDGPQIEAPELMADIAEMLEFKTEFVE